MITAGHTAIRRIAAARASLDAEVMDEVEGNVERRRNARVMATTEEQSTLDEALRRVHEQFGALRGNSVVSQECTAARPN